MSSLIEFLELVGMSILAALAAMISALFIMLIISAYMMALASPIILIVYLITK